ncbi:MAG TPA: alkaline phosphatase family protein, partial [Terriglobia bacterium]|nr:alkaline phosphatase family protein [Terriglobia bacterium]
MTKKSGLIVCLLVVAVVAFLSRPVTTRSQSGGTLPAFGHVFIVVEENAGFSQTTGSNMPYLTSLYSNTAGLTGVFGGLATNYKADTHPSIGNYFTLSTGQILTNNDSETPSSFPVSVNNIALALQNAGKTWKDYRETNGTYYVRHDPLAYMTNISSSNIVSFSQFSTDLANGTLPNLSWIVPNGCDDGHDCSLSTADNWLKSNIGPVLSSALFQKDGLLIVVFDEDGNTGNSCGLTTGTGCGGQVEAVVVSPFVTSVSGGARSSGSYEHENTLRTIAQGLGLTSFPGAASSATAMSDFFGTSGGGGGGGGTSTATVSPASLSFTQAVGSTSATQLSTLTNTGTNSLTSIGLAISPDPPFAFAGSGTCPTGPTSTLAPGATCTISVNFTPAAAQSYSGSVTVSDSAGTQTITLSGTGTSSGGGGTPLGVTTTSLAGGTQGQVYSAQLSATGGTPPYTWSLTTLGTALPTGLLLSSSGAITGTPTQSGTFAPVMQVADSSSPKQSAVGTVDITIAASTGGGGSGSCSLYVSPSGSDSNSGSSSNSPWQTVQKAFNSASAGQTVCFMAGTYPIASSLQNGYSQILNNSGSSSSPITFTNYPGQVAIIHGNTRVNGAYAKFQGTPMSLPYGLVFEGPTGQAVDLIDVMNTHDVTFDHVEMRNDDYHAGIYQQGGYNIKILGCYIHDNGRFSDGLTYINNDHGIYWAATAGGGNLVANNLIEHNLAMGMQLYSSGSSTTPSDVTVEENTFVDNGNYGMVVWGQSNTIVNNIFSGNGAMANNPQFNIYTSTNHVIDSNIFWSSISSQQGYANQTGQSVTHPMISDPLFVAPSSNDFQLQSTSPAINVANTSYQQATDILGVTRTTPDLGSYELASSGGGGGGGGGSTAVTLLPSSVSFTQAVGGTSATQFATITNTGTTTVTSVASAITPTGGAFSFAGVGTCTTGQSLAAGASCTFSVNFTPAAAQAYTGSLTVTDSAGTQTVSLSGTGTSSTGGGGGGGTTSCNLYVSPAGSDSNSGSSSSSPWKTVQKAFSSASAGQTVCFMAGTYPLTTTSGYSQTLNNSGTSSSPITFTNYPGAVAVIHGNTRINGSYVK